VPADNPATQRRETMIGHMARLEAQRRPLGDALRQLLQKADEQLDSMGPTIHLVEQHVQAGLGGGILAQRRLRTLLAERARLIQVIADIRARLEEEDRRGGT